MTGYNSQVGSGKYCIQHETDSRENYRAVEELIRRQIDGKPVTDVSEANVGMITTERAIEALKTIKEYCEQRRSEPCKTCILGDYFCDSWEGAWDIRPEDWQIPQGRTEEHD